ncbi:MAG: tRNA (N6-isopentenyl adenosine(37)-C2)-methylthiotransferase MiaB [Syntrophomonadaceae bacterium]
MNQNEPLKYHIYTYGCQMNVRDSEVIGGLLEDNGYEQASTPESADLILFNTCSVRHSAENKIYGKLGEINLLKRNNPELIVALGGCMAQLPDCRQKLKKIGVDVLFGTHNLHEVPFLVSKSRETGEKVWQVRDEEGREIEEFPANRKTGLSAFVNIMYGCNNFCSYCIVPYTRGRERSRKPEDIINEIQHLAEQGCREVTLLGQNVNSYGKTINQDTDFADLLGMVNGIDGIERIRFTTSHPKDMSDRLIETIAVYPKVCEHVHVPLQAGSNRILQKMNRKYTREHYLELVGKMRDRIPGIAITSDLIVGFPGESEEDFKDTLDMVNRVRFDAAFTFLYSPRQGTRAAELTDQIPIEIKKLRLNELMKVQYQIAKEINSSLEGSVQEVFVEGPSKTNAEKLMARTRTNRIVIISAAKDLIGQIINVRITEGKTFSLVGDVVL